MPRHYLFNIIRDMYPTNIYRSILPHKAADASHIISIVRMLVSPKHVDVRIEHVMYAR